MEFQLGLHLHISQFEDLDFYQFQWKYYRLIEHIKKLNSNNNTMDGSKFG